MNQIEVFKNNEFGEIRTVIVNGEPMFCLGDICKALGIKNVTDVAKRLDEDERTRLNLGRAGRQTLLPSPAYMQLSSVVINRQQRSFASG